MALDMHLELKGGSVTYTGESKHKKHAGKIQLLAWSWGMSQSGSFGHGSGGGAGKANIQDISVTKYLDKSSTQFMKALTTGAHADSAILYVSKAGGTQDDYLKITLTSVMITSYSTGGSGGEDMLTENISLAFAKFDIAYSTQDDKGKVSEAGTVQYSVEEVA
ncbi:hypothetical protein B0E47_09370 [Rhodanobacter sp. B05]|uniref:Hcp family type VI secretion system effector n=1 Tax=Rhodanobacter sp. B05 TaxID=1945859 RepID=UPI0009872102|nr:type VI secretion system tube protein Hcp [Rhodanobacter sp. B05]OOG55024.1 hypothetical protein B0E47_09370 [Rhodanobacter sp. B05]